MSTWIDIVIRPPHVKEISQSHHKLVLYLFFCLCLAVNNVTFAHHTKDLNQVKFTNNTTSDINIRVTFFEGKKNYKSASDNNQSITLHPYETKSIFSFIHFKPNKIYDYEVQISNNQNLALLKIGFNIAINSVFIPKFNINYSDDHGTQKINFDRDGLAHYPLHPMQHCPTNGQNNCYENSNATHSYSLHAHRYFSLCKMHHNYHLVLDEIKNTLANKDGAQILNVLTYNTQLMPLYTGIVDKLNHPSVRAAFIPALIADYDVVIMEELFSKTLRDKMILLMSKSFPFHSRVLGFNSKKILTGGVVIFSKWPIIAEDQMVYRAGNDFDKLAAKGALYVKINKQQRIYHFIGTHMQSGNVASCTEERRKQIYELEAFINTLNIPAEEALLLGGDFNVDEFGPEIKLLTTHTHTQIPMNTGLLRYSCDGNINTMMSNKSRVRLDFILPSNNHLLPISANNHIVVLRAFDNKKLWPGFDLSDHFSVAGEFVYPSIAPGMHSDGEHLHS